MKVRISVTLSEELLRSVDRRAEQQKTTRSNLIKAAVQAFVAQPARDEQNARELEIINRNANSLNREASDVLEYLGRQD